MSKQLEGRIALITGASRGIGAAVARAYAAQGAHVVLMARSQSGLEEVDDAIRSAGGTATLMPFDLKKTDELEALGPTLVERFGRLDIFVANAGILGTLSPVSHSSLKDWRDVFAVNVTANVQLIRTLEPALRASDAGRAIFVIASPKLYMMPFWGEYLASKAALSKIAETWAAETRQTNLKINMISPGAVRTELLAQAFPGGFQGRAHVPDDITPMFVELALPSCLQHGQIFDLPA